MWTHYLKLAIKVLLRRKFFTFISLFGIVFTLAVLMTATTLLDHLLGAHPPDIRTNRTLGTFRVVFQGPQSLWQTSGLGYGFLDRYARDLPGVACFSICSDKGIVADSFLDGRRVRSLMKYTDGAFWQIMSFHFLEGAPYSNREMLEANPVAVISARTRDQFFGRSAAVNRPITLNGRRFKVVGVVENVSRLRMVPFADVWTPIDVQGSPGLRTSLMGDFRGLFLAREAADFPRIQEAFQARLQNVVFPNPQNYNHITCELETLADALASGMGLANLGGSMGLTVFIAMLMVLFMVLPTVNLVNINVSRIMERSGEIGIRKAFGASSRALVQQFLLENLLLTVAGGLLGFLATQAFLQGIAWSGWIPNAHFTFNLRLFGCGVALTAFFGLFSGIYPAWRMSRMMPVQAIKGGAA